MQGLHDSLLFAPVQKKKSRNLGGLTYIMQKGLIKAAVLMVIFVTAVMIFGRVMNHTNEDLTTEMQEATLPVISLYTGNTEINRLHGYSAAMNAAYMRDTITPIAENRTLPIAIQKNQTEVDSISYEIRSLDAVRLIANADVESYEERKGKIKAELTIQNLVEAGEEYLLIIKLGSADRTIYYYTRIMEPVDCYVDECIAFVMDFNEKTFDEDESGTLSSYMEKTTADNDSLHVVTLNSSLKQVGWSEFDGEKLTQPVPSVKEITDTYNVIVLSYVVTNVGENGQSEYYNVEEYYRVRYTSSRIYLLNFERTMNEIFRGENDCIGEKEIMLGIRSQEVEYKTNEAGDSVAFVQEGELWGYNAEENTLAKVFSFRGYEGIDERENFGEHDIKIVAIDEAGSMDFIVYGYMNRGIHEGQVGIAVYHYDSLSNTNEELAFIPSDKSYEMLRTELGQLMYVNEGGELFLMVGGIVYGIDLNTLNMREVIQELAGGTFAASESNRFVAWLDTENGSTGSTIFVKNLSNQTEIKINAASGEYIKPLGFMEEDFVYGVAKAADVFTDAAGNEIFPMYQVKIVDVSADGESVLKTYEKSGYYIAGVEIEGYTMYLNRIRHNGTAYVPAAQDMIMNREGDSSKLIDIDTFSTEEKMLQVQLVLSQMLSEKMPRILTPKETILEEDRTITLEEKNKEARYYVYVKGDIVFVTDQVTEAVAAANEKMGVVIGDDMKYVWKRSRKAIQMPSRDIGKESEDEDGSIAQCIDAMMETAGTNINVSALLERGETPKDILNNTLKDMRVFDLTGCSVEEVLYYVSCGSPVFAMAGSSEAVLITGYDATGIYIYEPSLGMTRKELSEEAEQRFSHSGNVFFTYLNK